MDRKTIELPIPCLDIKRQNEIVRAEIFDAFNHVYDKTAFSGGQFVMQFEQSFANYINAKHVIGVGNGTHALHLAMRVLGIGPGDEVILPANTFIATAWGISYVGATPVFVDCDADTWEIDVTKIEEKITKRTKAIIGVHLYGQPFDIDPVIDICKKHKLFLIEDSAQAQGARYKGQIVGTFGDLSCFSFYPGKNLGACGEAGAITTNNEAYSKHLNSLRNHGSNIRYHHDEIGYNYRMGGLEGASLNVKLKYLENWNNKRREIANLYHSKIKNSKLKLQSKPNWADGVYHLFVITTPNRDDLVNYLTENKITPAFHYPVPCHLQIAFANLGYKRGDFPNSEYLADHCVSLPMFAELTDDEIAYVIETMNKY